MLGVNPKIYHTQALNYKEARSMSQKKRKLEEEKRKTTKEEVDKLINVRFIREAWYTTCLTSAITVKKANEK